MDALGVFELGAKAGRAYVRAIRQAWAEAFAEAYKDRPADPESDYYASRLGVAEECGEALEPSDRQAFEAECMAGYDPTAGPTPSDLCVCGHTLYVHALTFCDVASHYEVDDCPCSRFRLASDAEPLDMHPDDVYGRLYVQPANARRETFGPYETPEAFAPQVPSSSAGRGVGSPGVSAGAEEPAPPGKRHADNVEAVIADVLRGHFRTRVDGGANYYCYTGTLNGSHGRFADYAEWCAHVAPLIAAAVGATPTPKPAEQPTTFPCVVTDCPERFAEYDELNTHSYWEHLEPDLLHTSDDPLVTWKRYPGASPTGDFKWFSIKVTSPKPKAQK